MNNLLSQIRIGDLVEGTSIHNHGLIGFVTDFNPTFSAEYKVHYLVSKKYTPEGFYPIYEKYYDIKKLS